MHGHSIKETRQKIMVGTFSIYLILAVSLGASIAYWYILAGISTNQNESTFWIFIIWLVVAVGLVAELIKKITLSTFRNPTIWGVATFVSVLTVMGTYSILDNQKQNQLIKQSDGYQMAKSQKAEALKKQAKFAYAGSFNISQLEKQKRTAGNKARWGTFNRLKKDIEAKKQYDSAVATLGLSTDNMNQGTAGNVSSNPLLTNLAKIFGIPPELLKSIFYLIVTLLLEVTAYWIGGQVEQLKDRLNLTEAEILDIRNKAVFGVSMRDFNQAIFDNVVVAQTDQQEAEKEIEKLRKTNRKKLPASETAQQVKRLRTDSQQQQKIAKQPPRPASSFTPQNSLNIAHTQAIYQPKKAGDFPFGFIPRKQSKKAIGNSLKRRKNSLNRLDSDSSLTASNKAEATMRKTRKTDTPDTGTRGETAQRYRALKKHIKKEIEAERKKKNKVTISYIRTFKYGTKKVGYPTAKKYHEALKEEGIIS